MVRQSARRRELDEHVRRPRVSERRRRFRGGPRVEPEMKVSRDPALLRRDQGLIAAFRRVLGRR
ncbi:MAG TPA: hypothetical protein VM598_05675 [Bdellovibrionota bacterium]|nr:hypothetical protein [Bdellovibrionota bacterium]